MRKPRLVHGASLTWFLIFGNSLSSEPFPFGHPQSKTGSLQAVRAAVDRRAGALPRASTPFQRQKTDVPARCSGGPASLLLAFVPECDVDHSGRCGMALTDINELKGIAPRRGFWSL